MSQDVSPSRGRNRSGLPVTSMDPYDQAEQGFAANSADGIGTGSSHEARRTLSLRNSLRSSDSTLAGLSEEPIELSISGAERDSVLLQVLARPASRFAKLISSLQRPTFLWSNSQHSTNGAHDTFKEGYAKFQNRSYGEYPDGWPRLAAFMESSPSFGNFRKFGQSHTRLLAIHMSNITDIERELDNLDKSDAAGGAKTNWRLRNRYHREGLDTTKRELLKRLEAELLAYGIANAPSPNQLDISYILTSYNFSDTLLERFRIIKSMNPTPTRDHDSLFKWIFANKPLDELEYDWIWDFNDFVSLTPPRKNRFERFILSHLDERPDSWFKACMPFIDAQVQSLTQSFYQKLFQAKNDRHQDEDAVVKFFSIARIKMFARLTAVFFAVFVLFIPVILFFLTPMSRGWMAVVVLAFDFIFSVMISMLTDAGDKEIFVGTATYCAVLVTFLGNLQGGVTHK
ncbi:hypothetical protein BGZ60DRAFT_529714 [Tricladium varicosporioides]|nr:hypothetical protein BGZ60DRAFT_529714 [Hymenoscyphus varicosporioides]